MKWRKTTLQHGRKDYIDLVVGGRGKTVTTFVVISRSVPQCHSADRLSGRLADIRLDQHGTPVEWEDCELPACCRSPELDMRQKRDPPGFERTLDYLKYHLANAMIAVFSDRGFSRHFKKLVIGEWAIASGHVIFEKDGRYAQSGTHLGMLAGAPKFGRWYCGGNMLHLMTDPPDRGIRTLIVNITENELIFPGGKGALRHVYSKIHL